MQVQSIFGAIKRETALLLICLLIGLALLPLAIYLVGLGFFGTYGGGSFTSFYSGLHVDIRRLDPVVWYLVLSPWLIIQCVRATFGAFRLARNH